MSDIGSPHDRRLTRAESFLLMGTVVTIRVVGRDGDRRMQEDIDRAADLMRSVENTLSRFDEQSALRRLSRTPGVLTPVPPMLFYALQVALEAASLTGGAFDPTVGRRMEEMGFDRNYLTGERVTSEVPPGEKVSFRDITLVEEGLKVRLERPLGLDLGAVAKGLAVDLAARSLAPWEGILIDAGGDVFASGVDPHGEPWQIGVEDPRKGGALLQVLRITDAAVCTSGSQKRRSPDDPLAHHLIDARTGRSVGGLLSCTVVGPQAMMADVVATSAFLLGPDEALPFIARMGLDGLVITQDFEMRESAGMEKWKP